MDDKNVYDNLRIASFSCYLNSAEVALKLTGGELPDSSSTVISPEETPPRSINVGRSKNNEPEISIFGADKYFNVTSYHANAYGQKKERCVDLPQAAQNVRPKTQSTTSEVSSWNSQSALLQNLPRNPSHTKSKRGVAMRYFPFFGCKGPCLDKKGTNVEGIVNPGVLHGIQQSQPGIKKVEQFSFPVVNKEIENMKVKNHFEEKDELQDLPRNSIEVFGSTFTRKGDIALNLERELSVLTWDAIPKPQSFVATSFGSPAVCDDMASDASSDLFEIENIAGSGFSALSRQESCKSGCMTPTTQYAPSEASIEWSVVTASAADFRSVVSEYEGRSVSVAGDIVSGQQTYKTANPTDLGKNEAPKSGASRLLGCRSHKAVRVAESNYRTNEKAKGETKHSMAKTRPSQ